MHPGDKELWIYDYVYDYHYKIIVCTGYLLLSHTCHLCRNLVAIAKLWYGMCTQWQKKLQGLKFEILSTIMYRASFKDCSVEGSTTKRDFREKRKSGEVYCLGGLGVLPQRNFVFLSSLDLISCNFSTIFTHFQTKKDFY